MPTGSARKGRAFSDSAGISDEGFGYCDGLARITPPETSCRCGERIEWLRSATLHRSAWVHATGSQEGLESCYDDGRTDVAEPADHGRFGPG